MVRWFALRKWTTDSWVELHDSTIAAILGTKPLGAPLCYACGKGTDSISSLPEVELPCSRCGKPTVMRLIQPLV
jgi:hypothetical protein